MQPFKALYAESFPSDTLALAKGVDALGDESGKVLPLATRQRHAEDHHHRFPDARHYSTCFQKMLLLLTRKRLCNITIVLLF